MRSPFSGDSASSIRSGDSGRASTAWFRRRLTAWRVTLSSVPWNSAPRPSNTCTSAPARSRNTSRAWCAAWSGSSRRAPGAASGTWKRGRPLTCAPAARPIRRRSARPTAPCRAYAAVTASTSSVSRPDRMRTASGAHSAASSSARSISSGAIRFASTTSNAPARNGRPPSARTTRSGTSLRRPCSADDAVASGSKSVATARRAPRRSAATARMPVPAPTSITRAIARRSDSSTRSARQSRVVWCVPVPNARPGSIRIVLVVGLASVPLGHDREAGRVERAEVLAEARHPVDVGQRQRAHGRAGHVGERGAQRAFDRGIVGEGRRQRDAFVRSRFDLDADGSELPEHDGRVVLTVGRHNDLERHDAGAHGRSEYRMRSAPVQSGQGPLPADRRMRAGGSRLAVRFEAPLRKGTASLRVSAVGRDRPAGPARTPRRRLIAAGPTRARGAGTRAPGFSTATAGRPCGGR